MSGWIPLEKDLLTDPRFIRLTAWYHDRHHANTVNLEDEEQDEPKVTHGRYMCNACAYHCLGHLAGLWFYADTHIDENDCIAITPWELSDLLGCTDFVPALREYSRGTWVQFTEDKQSVILPKYQEHNGMKAKAKLKTRVRVQRLRKRNGVTAETQERYIDERAKSNGAALPDQTKPHQTKQKESSPVGEPKKAPTPLGQRIPDDFVLTPERAMVATVEKLTDPQRVFADFRDYWTAKPGADGRKLDWDATWRRWCRTEGEKRGRTATPPAWSPRLTQESALAAIEAAHREHDDDNQEVIRWES
jgi:hypothetical protein